MGQNIWFYIKSLNLFKFGRSAGNWVNYWYALTINNLSYIFQKLDITSDIKFVNIFRYILTRFPERGIDLSTSETLRDKISEDSVLMTPIKTISVHIPTHQKPLSDDAFGYYLAGLIDGDGCFVYKQLIICFAEADSSLAYFIKSRLGWPGYASDI